MARQAGLRRGVYDGGAVWRAMKVGIEAGRLGRGGEAILSPLVDTLLQRPEVHSITVFGEIAPRPGVNVVQTSSGRLDTLRWALRDWARVATGFDRAVSFSGFATAPRQTVLVHNALYYDPIADTLPPALRLRLQVLRELTHDAVLNAQHVVVQSSLMQEHVRAAHGVMAQKIVTAPEALVVENGPKTDLLWVGNEIPFKDYRTAIAAAQRLGRHLTLIGNTVPMPSGIGYSWVGDLNREQVFAYYHSAQALLMTSRVESLGLPLIEAMQAGLPVVAPDLPYARELCGDAAEFFEAGSFGACAQAVNRLEQRRETLPALGHQRVAQISAERSFERWVDLILE